jgi:hypothetical protein
MKGTEHQSHRAGSDLRASRPPPLSPLHRLPMGQHDRTASWASLGYDPRLGQMGMALLCPAPSCDSLRPITPTQEPSETNTQLVPQLEQFPWLEPGAAGPHGQPLCGPHFENMAPEAQQLISIRMGLEPRSLDSQDRCSAHSALGP